MYPRLGCLVYGALIIMKQVQSAGKKVQANDVISNEGLLRINRDLKFIGIRGSEDTGRDVRGQMSQRDRRDRKDIRGKSGIDKNIRKDLDAAVKLLVEIKGFAEKQKKDFEECRGEVRVLRNEVLFFKRFNERKENLNREWA